jgi:error-prone DNA polymerase
MAAVISNGGGYYSTFGYLSEARRMGLRVLPPDINESEIKYIGKGKEIRVGLMQLKEVSQEGVEFIVRERTKHGPFTSLDHFLLRTSGHVHLQDARVLVKAGCVDTIAQGSTRPALQWKALRFFETPSAASSLDLFKSPLPPPFQKTRFPSPGGRGQRGGGNKKDFSPPPYSRSLMLKHELDTFGFYLSIHPLDRYTNVLKGLHYVKACDLHLHIGKQVTTIGWLVTGKTVQTRDGDPMKFVSFEDTTGIYETVLFPKVYNRFCHMLNEMRPYLLKGKVEQDFTAVTLTVNGIEFLDRHNQENQLTSPSPQSLMHFPTIS